MFEMHSIRLYGQRNSQMREWHLRIVQDVEGLLGKGWKIDDQQTARRKGRNLRKLCWRCVLFVHIGSKLRQEPPTGSLVNLLPSFCSSKNCFLRTVMEMEKSIAKITWPFTNLGTIAKNLCPFISRDVSDIVGKCKIWRRCSHLFFSFKKFLYDI